MGDENECGECSKLDCCEVKSRIDWRFLWGNFVCNGDFITNSEIKIIEYLSWIGVFDGMWLVLI